jgi:hypothetical protein
MNQWFPLGAEQPAMNDESSIQASCLHPPKPSLILRVGVIGHRLDKLTGADLGILRANVRHELEGLMEVVNQIPDGNGNGNGNGEPIFTAGFHPFQLISSLAEGADRIVATEATELGFALQCPLPFASNEFEQDFGCHPSLSRADSVREFHDLLDRHTTVVLELDGAHDPKEVRHASYAAAGRILLNHSTILIAIWDGQVQSGAGGTGQMVAEALEQEIPIIWIRSRAPHEVIYLIPSEGKPLKNPGETLCNVLPRLMTEGDRFRKVVTQLLRPPDPHPQTGHHATGASLDLREKYFQETQPRLTLGVTHGLFTEVLSYSRGAKGREPQIRWPDIRFKDFLAKVGRVDTREGKLQLHAAWASALSRYDAGLYRSAFVFIYFMSPFAILFALLGFALGWTESHQTWQHRAQIGLILAEFVVIGSIVIIWFWGRGRHWHERWLDYRLLAEHLRLYQALQPLARIVPSTRLLAPHLRSSDPRQTWVYW